MLLKIFFYNPFCLSLTLQENIKYSIKEFPLAKGIVSTFLLIREAMSYVKP